MLKINFRIYVLFSGAKQGTEAKADTENCLKHWCESEWKFDEQFPSSALRVYSFEHFWLMKNSTIWLHKSSWKNISVMKKSSLLRLLYVRSVRSSTSVGGRSRKILQLNHFSSGLISESAKIQKRIKELCRTLRRGNLTFQSVFIIFSLAPLGRQYEKRWKHNILE